MDSKVKEQTLTDLMDFYADVWECFPNLLKGMTNEEILDKLMKFANLTEDDLDVTEALEKIQRDLDIDAFYDELEAEGIEV